MLSKKPRLFLSYRHNASADLARFIHDRLTALKVDVFFDVEDITIGRFASTIEREIINRDYFFVILTPTSLESEWVRREIQFALKHRKQIIPLLVQGFNFSSPLPDEIKELADYEGIPYDYANPQVAIDRIKKALEMSSNSDKNLLRRIWDFGSRPAVVGWATIIGVIVAVIALFLANPPAPIATPTLLVPATATPSATQVVVVSSPTSLPIAVSVATQTIVVSSPTSFPSVTQSAVILATSTMVPDPLITNNTAQVIFEGDDTAFYVIVLAPDGQSTGSVNLSKLSFQSSTVTRSFARLYSLAVINPAQVPINVCYRLIVDKITQKVMPDCVNYQLLGDSASRASNDVFWFDASQSLYTTFYVMLNGTVAATCQLGPKPAGTDKPCTISVPLAN